MPPARVSLLGEFHLDGIVPGDGEHAHFVALLTRRVAGSASHLGVSPPAHHRSMLWPLCSPLPLVCDYRGIGRPSVEWRMPAMPSSVCASASSPCRTSPTKNAASRTQLIGCGVARLAASRKRTSDEKTDLRHRHDEGRGAGGVAHSTSDVASGGRSSHLRLGSARGGWLVVCTPRGACPWRRKSDLARSCLR